MKIPPPRFRIAPLSEDLHHVRGFRDLQTFFPTLSKIYRISKHQSESVWLDTKLRMVGLDISGCSGPCRVRLQPNLDTETAGADLMESPQISPAFLKVTHLLDPIRWMRGRYSLPKHTGLPWHTKTWATAWNKLQDPWNQAYVEALASYALGRLREEGVSPHFNLFYGAFCAQADTYRYNLTEDFASMRNARWFWNGQKKGIYRLRVLNAQHPEKEVDPELLEEITKEPSICDSSSSSSDGGDSKDQSICSIEEEEITITEHDGGAGGGDAIELASLHSDACDEMVLEESSESAGSISEDQSENEELAEDDESELSEQDDLRIYAEIQNFPVMLIAVEENRGTMDTLLEKPDLVGASVGTPEWEARWSAWLFQVTAALSCAQSLLGFTHNDLHTNNIVWSTTEEEYLYYKNRAGALFRVPTYGKIFRIIDFGRAIFSINDQQFISDDFKAGNDADGQYCFKPLHPRPDPADEVHPNPSFDLCRLAVSLFESLFPEAPKEKEGGEILSSEEGLEVLETESHLYNTLWKWMIDDKGENVLIEPDGDERFPDFDLYKHIAASVYGAVPAHQFSKPLFDQFQVTGAEVPEGVSPWNLFC